MEAHTVPERLRCASLLLDGTASAVAMPVKLTLNREGVMLMPLCSPPPTQFHTPPRYPWRCFCDVGTPATIEYTKYPYESRYAFQRSNQYCPYIRPVDDCCYARSSILHSVKCGLPFGPITTRRRVTLVVAPTAIATGATTAAATAYLQHCYAYCLKASIAVTTTIGSTR